MRAPVLTAGTQPLALLTMWPSCCRIQSQKDETMGTLPWASPEPHHEEELGFSGGVSSGCLPSFGKQQDPHEITWLPSPTRSQRFEQPQQQQQQGSHWQQPLPSHHEAPQAVRAVRALYSAMEPPSGGLPVVLEQSFDDDCSDNPFAPIHDASAAVPLQSAGPKATCAISHGGQKAKAKMPAFLKDHARALLTKQQQVSKGIPDGSPAQQQQDPIELDDIDVSNPFGLAAYNVLTSSRPASMVACTATASSSSAPSVSSTSAPSAPSSSTSSVAPCGDLLVEGDSIRPGHQVDSASPDSATDLPTAPGKDRLEAVSAAGVAQLPLTPGSPAGPARWVLLPPGSPVASWSCTEAAQGSPGFPASLLVARKPRPEPHQCAASAGGAEAAPAVIPEQHQGAVSAGGAEATSAVSAAMPEQHQLAVSEGGAEAASAAMTEPHQCAVSAGGAAAAHAAMPRPEPHQCAMSAGGAESASAAMLSPPASRSISQPGDSVQTVAVTGGGGGARERRLSRLGKGQVEGQRAGLGEQLVEVQGEADEED